MDDVRAVMDAADRERAALFGHLRGRADVHAVRGDLPAAHVRARALRDVRENTPTATTTRWGHTPEVFEPLLERDRERAGAGHHGDVFAPSVAKDERYVQSWARFERERVSPGGGPRIAPMRRLRRPPRAARRSACPRSIVHRAGDLVLRSSGRAIWPSTSPARSTSSSPGPTTSPGSATTTPILDEVQEFLTGVRPGPRARSRARHRAVHRHRRLDRARRASSATRAGASCSRATTRSCAAS